MSKDPAFLFYTNDFYSGIADLTMEERGQYITLMCLQHTKGHLSDKIIKLNVPNVSPDVMDKFEKDDDGLFFNKRLENEIKKRKDHAEKQRQRAKDGWKKRKKDIKINDAVASSAANAAALPLVNENRNENRNVSKNIKGSIDGKQKYSDDVQKCYQECLKYFDGHLQPKSNRDKNNWLDTIDKLNRIDNVPFVKIIQVTKAAREDSFWNSNFLSLTKLRKKNNDGIKYIVSLHEKLKSRFSNNFQEDLQSLKDKIDNDPDHIAHHLNMF